MIQIIDVMIGKLTIFSLFFCVSLQGQYITKDTEYRVVASDGAILPSAMPPIMQRPTQTVRYLSNTFVIFLCSGTFVILNLLPAFSGFRVEFPDAF